MTTINIREITEQDFPFMQGLIYRTWYTDHNQDTADQTLSYALAELDLNHHLNSATFGLVAELNGQALGFILASVKAEKALMRMLQTDPRQALLHILTAPETTKAERTAYLKREHEANTSMLQQASKNYDGEICLFIVDPAAQGSGIGSRLYQAVLDYFLDHNVKDYFLYTDDGCAYQFYDRRNMHRIQAQPYNKQDKIEDSSFNFYLYENK